jgi:hypothetical protein
MYSETVRDGRRGRRNQDVSGNGAFCGLTGGATADAGSSKLARSTPLEACLPLPLEGRCRGIGRATGMLCVLPNSLLHRLGGLGALKRAGSAPAAMLQNSIVAITSQARRMVVIRSSCYATQPTLTTAQSPSHRRSCDVFPDFGSRSVSKTPLLV